MFPRGNDTGYCGTLPSDSSPFKDKYEMDDEGEILGEVSYAPLAVEISSIPTFWLGSSPSFIKYPTVNVTKFMLILLSKHS